MSCMSRMDINLCYVGCNTWVGTSSDAFALHLSYSYRAIEIGSPLWTLPRTGMKAWACRHAGSELNTSQFLLIHMTTAANNVSFHRHADEFGQHLTSSMKILLDSTETCRTWGSEEAFGAGS
jgi:hypothetical protein